MTGSNGDHYMMEHFLYAEKKTAVAATFGGNEVLCLRGDCGRQKAKPNATAAP